MAILSREEFIELFWKNAGKTTKYVEAYHRTEEYHIKTFGRRKYADYDSFRKSRDYKKKR